MVDFKALVPWRNNNKAQTPATRGEDFFDPFVTFRREMDRMFDDFFGGGALRPAHAGWQALTPAVDVDETDKEMVITAELPIHLPKPAELQRAVRRIEVKSV
jgi:HSP20 family protein